MTKSTERYPNPGALRDTLLGGRESVDLSARAHDQARAGAGDAHRECERAKTPRSALICPSETGLPTMTRTVRCQHCEGVIRVSEPMIVLADGQWPRTSTAGVRDAGGSEGECYHPACYSVVARSAGWSVSSRQRLANYAR
jgi:hypothetical protein